MFTELYFFGCFDAKSKTMVISITAACNAFSLQILNIRLMKEDLSVVILVGPSTNSARQNVGQNSIYCLTL